MEIAVHVHIEPLPEGVYLATSDELPGLIAQGRTIAETLVIARDVARNLVEARREREGSVSFTTAAEHLDYTIVVGAFGWISLSRDRPAAEGVWFCI